MKMFVFGSSLTSSYWNGAATYYRGIYKNLAALGHEITFAEPDIYDRQKHRDVHHIDYAQVIVYHPGNLEFLLRQAAGAGLVIKHSGVGAEDEILEQRVLECRSARTRVAFWDVDAPATLARLENNPADRFRALIPEYDFIFTYGGGPPVVEQYCRLGARNCHPIYNGVEPDTHYPVAADPEFSCDLLFVGHRLPDRERRVEQFFLSGGRIGPRSEFYPWGRGLEGEVCACECALDRPCGDRLSQPSELLGAHGAEFESGLHGQSWLFSPHPRVRGRWRRSMPDYRCLGRNREVF